MVAPTRVFMSREAERSIREREAPAKQSGKKQISSGLTA
jgi:hypothetical protein